MEKKKDKKIILVIIIAVIWTLLPAIFFTGMIFLADEFDYSNYIEEADGSINIEDGDLIIKEGVKNYYDSVRDIFYVEGYLVNNTDEDLEYILVEYTLYDINNNILGTAEAYLNKLEAKGTWKFKATYEENDAKQVIKVKISNIEY